MNNLKFCFMKVVLMILATSFSTIGNAKEYDIKKLGAKPDGTTLNTEVIQQAINAASRDKGGRVIVPKGTYLTGSLVMKSNVELHLKQGAILLGSKNVNDYKAILKNNWKSLILAKDAKAIAITGEGTIDGQGAALALSIDSLFYIGQLDSSLYTLKERRPAPHARPQIIQFTSCSGVTVLNVTIKNAASWVQTYDLCEDVWINGIKVDSDTYWNNDGIDIIDCEKVKITNCDVNSSDDGICIKSYQRAKGVVAMVKDLYISDCTVRSSACAVKLGTSSYGGFKNVLIQNIRVKDTYRSAIAIECWETGTVENIHVRNVTATNTGNAIFIRLSKRDVFKDYPMGVLRNVVIEDVTATIPKCAPDKDYEIRGPALPFFHNTFPASITGIPGHKVENVTLKNIDITYPGGGNPAYANMPISRLDDVPEKIDEYPEFSMFGELPAWGFYVRHVDGLSFNNITLKIDKPDYRPAFVFDDVDNLVLNGIKVKKDTKDEWIIYKNMKRP